MQFLGKISQTQDPCQAEHQAARPSSELVQALVQ